MTGAPRTAAGRELLDRPQNHGGPAISPEILLLDILAIEAEAATPDPVASPAPLDAAELAKLIGQAMYGWGSDEPNEATGYLLRAEAETVARHLLREGWQPPPRVGQPVAEEPRP